MDVGAQIEAMESGALVRPVPELGTLVVTGEERLSWLAGLVTNDIKGLSPGQGAFSLSVQKNGRVQAELWIVVDADRVLLGLRDDLCDKTREAFDYYLIMEDAEVVVPGERFAWWLAHGPEAQAVCQAARKAGAIAAMTRWGDIPTAVIAAPSGASPNLAEDLVQPAGAVLATPEGWQRARIERHLPQLGVDYEVGCYPQEAALEHLAVSFNKGCYVGQEAVFMLQKRGHVQKRLVRLVVDAPVAIAPGSDITTAEGEKVGVVTSAARAGDRSFAMGMVRYKQTLPGTELRIGERPAKVSCLAERESACS